MSYDDLIQWLLKGDVAIQYQVHRDLLSEFREELQAKIQEEGWGARMLNLQKPDGHWRYDTLRALRVLNYFKGAISADYE